MAAVILDQTRRLLEIEADLTAGENSGWIELPQDSHKEVLLAWFPGAGGTMAVDITIDSLATVRDATPEAIVLSADSIEDGDDALPALVTAVRFTATTQDGKYRVVA